MMRIAIVSIVMTLVCIQSLKSQTLSIDKVRDQFFTMEQTENGALKLYQTINSVGVAGNPLLLAYRGACSAASAESVSGVRSKLENFNRGKNDLEKAVELKPLDAEIRFLRLATQLKSPGFLGYKADIKYDKAMIINTFNLVPGNHPNAYLYQRICGFLLANAEPDASEIRMLNQLIEKFKTEK